MAKRVCLQPCLGINTPAATLGRQACYLVHDELRSGQTDLGCSPALYAEVEEDVEFIRNDFVLAIESCERACASSLVREKGGEVAATVYVEDIMRDAGVDVQKLARDHLDLSHEAVEVLANHIAAKVDELLGSQ